MSAIIATKTNIDSQMGVITVFRPVVGRLTLKPVVSPVIQGSIAVHDHLQYEPISYV